jgi:hypothetical protein
MSKFDDSCGIDGGSLPSPLPNSLRDISFNYTSPSPFPSASAVLSLFSHSPCLPSSLSFRIIFLLNLPFFLISFSHASLSSRAISLRSLASCLISSMRTAVSWRLLSRIATTRAWLSVTIDVPLNSTSSRCHSSRCSMGEKWEFR